MLRAREDGPAEAHRAADRRSAGKRLRVLLALVTLLVLCAVVPVPYAHVYRMTHFADGGSATASPSELSTIEKIRTLLIGVRVPRPTNDSDPGSLQLEYETVALETADGLRLEAWRIPGTGAGPRDLVVLFHGYADSKESLLMEAREFHRWGADALLVDFRGSGGSDGDRTSLGWHEALDVEAAWRRALVPEPPRRVILYGASMGAVAVCRAVSELDLEPDAVILEAPFNDMLDTTANRFRQMGLPAFPFAHALVFWGGRQHDFDAFSHSPQDYVRALDCPTLLLFGEEDEDVTPRDAAALLAHAGPSVQHRMLTGAGHPRLFPQQPGRWRSAVVAFLDALP